MDIFNMRLKELRKRFNLTQEELGKLIGKSKHTVNKYESSSNNRTPNPETLQKLSEVFDISVDYLIGNSDYPINNREQNFLNDIVKSPINQNTIYDLVTKHGITIENKNYTIEDIKAAIELTKLIQKLG